MNVLGLMAVLLLVQAVPLYGADTLAAVQLLNSGRAAEARVQLEALSKNGKLDATVALSDLLLRESGPWPRDPAAGCRYAEQASEAYASAKHNFALCNEKGLAGPPNLSLAAKLYEEAGAAGFPQSKCALGNMLVAGSGVPKNETRGAALCREAAESGNANAQADTGNFYLMGTGVARDPAMALKFYEKAAAQGQANAALIGGQIYWNGDGVAKDHVAAKRLWRIAYDRGHPQAAKLLGDEALTRMGTQGAPNKAAIEEAISYYERAMISEPDPADREEVAERLLVMQKIRATLP